MTRLRTVRLLVALGCTFAFTMLTACDREPSKKPTQAAGSTSSGGQAKGVVVSNGGRKLTFEHVPQRIITTGQGPAELLLKLGVGKSIVGIYYGAQQPVDPAIAVPFRELTSLSTDAPPSKEVVLPLKPDLVISAFPTMDFDSSRGGATIDDFAKVGSQVFGYTATSCKPSEATFEMFLSDVADLGKILRVEQAAQQLVEECRSRIAAVRQRVAGREKVKLVICFSASDQMLGVFGAGLLNDLVDAAGGTNVYSHEDATMVNASKEDFAQRVIEVYVIPDLPAVPSMRADSSAAWLFKTFPQAEASKRRRFVGIGVEKLNVGYRNVEFVEELARSLHPEAFAESGKP